MGWVSTPALAIAVSREGALGMIGADGLAAETLRGQLETVTAAIGPGDRVGVNFLVPFLDLAAFDVAAELAAVVECFYGEPGPALVARAHDAEALMSWQVGCLDEALAAAEAGCDWWSCKEPRRADTSEAAKRFFHSSHRCAALSMSPSSRRAASAVGRRWRPRSRAGRMPFASEPCCWPLRRQTPVPTMSPP